MCIEPTISAPPAPPAWHERESMRFTSGYYLPVPVTLQFPYVYPVEHFLHLSTTTTEQDFIAYTPSDTYGQADRQVRLKFGRYLKKFFPAMSDALIQSYVTELKSALAIAEKPASLHFTTDRETINRIFETLMCAHNSNCESCMYDKFTTWSDRPYHVYADSPDVAVAYVTAAGSDDIVSRSVASTKDKVWVRAYSIASGDNDTDCGTLKQMLKDAGYSKGNLTGNRLTKLPEHRGKINLPYIDYGGAYVRDDGNGYWIVTDGESEADWITDCSDGSATACGGDRCSECNEHRDDCECSYCECCDSYSRHGCENCSMCEVCERCTEHNSCNCARCSECHELLEGNHYTTTCSCTRCSECNEIEDDCECDNDESESKPKPAPSPVDAAMLEWADSDSHARNMAMTNSDIRNKLNRIFIYLRDSRGGDSYISSEYSLLFAVFTSIPYLQENV